MVDVIDIVDAGLLFLLIQKFLQKIGIDLKKLLWMPFHNNIVFSITIIEL